MSPDTPNSALRSKWPAGLLVVVLLVLPVLVAYPLYLGYQNQIKIAEISTRNLAAILETRFDATLRHADADLRALASDIPPAAMDQRSVARHQRVVNAELDRRLFSLGEMVAYRVHDANGDTLYSSNSMTSARINVADREFFRALRDDPAAGLLVSDVFTGRSSGRVVLVIARPVRDSRGSFIGTVHGVIDLEYYRQQFESLDLGANGVVALRRSDTHAQLVRWPDVSGAANTLLAADHPVRAALAAGGKAVTLHYAADPERIPRIMGIQAMRDYPFYFAVGLARDEVLAPWRTQTIVIAGSTLLLFALVAYLLIRVGRMRVREAGIRTTLARSESQFRELAQLVPVGICHFDASGKCTYANDRHLLLVGRSRDEVLGSAWSDFVHPDDCVKIRQMWQPAGTPRSAFAHEIRYVHPDGRLTHVLSEAQSETDADGTIAGYIVAQTDITLRKQAEAELLIAKQQAEKANIAKTRFLAAAGHDLRQPIQAINLFRAALSRTDLNEEQTRISEFLATSVHSLDDLLYSLLDISNLDAGQVRPQMTAVSVAELFAALDTEFAPLAQRKHLRFKLFYPMKDMILFTDPGLLRTVLRNLIDNALKYTERGGILVAARKRGGGALIQVWDTGVGIDARYGEQVFDEFFQIGNPLRDRTKGLGLGLAIARRMARLFKGEVSYRSRFGRGTVFEIALSLGRAARGEGPDAAA